MSRYSVSRRSQDWEAISKAVLENPGIYKCNVAAIVGCGPREMDGKLCGIEDDGYLLAEDDNGRLWLLDEFGNLIKK